MERAGWEGVRQGACSGTFRSVQNKKGLLPLLLLLLHQPHLARVAVGGRRRRCQARRPRRRHVAGDCQRGVLPQELSDLVASGAGLRVGQVGCSGAAVSCSGVGE